MSLLIHDTKLQTKIMKMRPIIQIVISILIVSTFTAGQSNAQNVLTGHVFDDETGQPMEFVQVALFNTGDSTLITGTITGEDGSFQLETGLTGSFLLMASFIGFEEVWTPVDITSGKNSIGEINLLASVTELGEVEITAAAQLFRSEADRRIFNVEYMTVAEGGTAIQLLETIPSVQLDEEGNITLRGSGNILIYINGRPTNLTADDTESILEQYPASAIKDIELITNPSARYDAEGVGGIINIILREERLQGLNAQVNLTSGTGNKYTGGINMNLRQNRWNFTSNYSYQYRERWGNNESYRENFMAGSSPIINQDYRTENFDQSHLLRLGAEYEINTNSSARLYSSMNIRSRDRGRTYNIRSMTNPNLLDSMHVRQLSEDQSRSNFEFGAGYNWNNANGRDLSAHVSYSMDSQDRIEYFDQQFFDGSMSEIQEKWQDQFYERPVDRRMLVLELDYEHGFGGDLLMETGLKSTFRHDDRSQNFRQLNPDNNQYEEVYIQGLPISNQFNRNENIHAGYLIMRNAHNRFSYMAGLRAEMTMTSSWQGYGLGSGFMDTENFEPAFDNEINNDYFNLFPSVFMSYEISQNQDLQASFSRRIRRPWVGSLMPFLNAQDFYNLRLGNPYLEPAHTDNYEINYIRGWENYMVTAGVFHRNITNGLTRLFVPFAEGSLVTWTNANTTNSTGVEIINYLTTGSNFDATLTGNFYHSMINGELEGVPYNNESYSWTLSLLGNMNIPGWFSTQASANYWGPRVIPQGHIKPVFSMNLGLRRNVMNNQGTISLNISDLFNTRRFQLETTSDNFYQHRSFFRESRIVTLGFTWRFRDMREQGSQQSNNGMNGDIDGLF
jgi:iron complex outermembrane recepter protein